MMVTLWIGWVALVAVGIALIALGERGWMDVRRGRCVACGHELHDPLPPCCSECGAELGRRDGIDWARPRPRLRLLVMGIVLGVVASFALPAVTAARLGVGKSERAQHRVEAMSPAELRAALAPVDIAPAPLDDAEDLEAALRADGRPLPGFSAESGPLWGAVEAAMADGTLSEAQLVAIADVAAQFTAGWAGRSGLRSPVPTRVLGSIASGGLMDDGDVAEIFRRAMIDLEVMGPSLAEVGKPIFLLPGATLTGTHSGMGLEVGLTVLGVSANGVELPLQDPPSRAFATFGSSVELPGRIARAVTLDTPGVVDLDVEIGLLVARPGPDAGLAAPQRTAWPAGQRPIPLARRVHRVEVVEGETLPRSLADPALMEEIKSALRMYVAIAPDVDGRSHVLRAVISSEPLNRCGAAFDVFIEPQAGAVADRGTDAGGPSSSTSGGVHMGRMIIDQRAFHALQWARQGMAPQPTWSTFEAWAPPELLDARFVTVRLAPVSSAKSRHWEGDHRWDLPLVFEDVPLERPRRERGRP